MSKIIKSWKALPKKLLKKQPVTTGKWQEFCGTLNRTTNLSVVWNMTKKWTELSHSENLVTLSTTKN